MQGIRCQLVKKFGHAVWIAKDSEVIGAFHIALDVVRFQDLTAVLDNWPKQRGNWARLLSPGQGFELGAAADSTSVFPRFRGKSSVFLGINGIKRS